MKALAGIGAALLVSGCAGMEALQQEPPHYSHPDTALIGSAYPVERIDRPQGFALADIYEANREQEHDSPDDHGKARVTEAGVSWLSRADNTAIATAMHQGASPGSIWLPWDESDGFEFVGDLRIQYEMFAGDYKDVTGDPASIPKVAPDCAAATHLATHSKDRQRRTIMTYAEGMPCNDLAGFGESDKEQLRERAYRVLGLK